MPLNKKTTSYSTTRFVGWLCCLPCTMTTALCCLMCCQPRVCVELTCFPCLDETLTEKAGSIASNFTSCLMGTAHPKLIELKNNRLQWDPKESIFTFLGTDWSKMLYMAIRDKVLAILDAYNFGNIPSTSLTEEEVQYIGNELKNAIFSKLPSAQDFFDSVAENHIANKDLDGCLTGALLSIINEDNFIFTQLNRISDDIVALRASKTSVAAVGLYKSTAAVPAESKTFLPPNPSKQSDPLPPSYSEATHSSVGEVVGSLYRTASFR